MSKRFNSIVIKLIVAFLLVILPLYTLSIALTVNSSGQMREEIERSNESVLLFHYANFQFELSRMVNLISEYSIDRDLTDFSTMIPVMSSYDISRQLNSILLKLRQMRSSSPYIQDVYYYLPVIDKVVSVSGGVDDSNSEAWAGLVENQGLLQGALTEYQDKLYLVKTSPTMLKVTMQPNFVLAIELSQNQLRHQLSSIRDGQQGGAFLSFGSENRIDITNAAHPEEVSDLFAYPSMQDVEEGRIYRQVTNEHHVYAIHNDEFQFQLVSYIPNEVLYEPIYRYTTWMWILTIVSLLIVLVFSFGIFRLIHRPLVRLMKSFRNLERGETATEIQHDRGDEFGYLYDQYNKTVNTLHELIQDNYVQRIRSQESQLKHLQSQITPHFLYNSLFTIKQMAEIEDTEGIKRFSDFLGRYFRFMTRDFESEISLKQEMEHSLVYLNIQQIRFSNRIHMELSEPPEHPLSLMVPRIILQPILENVFEHGLHATSHGGILRLTFRTGLDDFYIVVEDNGQHLTDERLSALQERLSTQEPLQEVTETTGLVNVHQRLRIRFGTGYGLYLSRSALGGLCVEIKLPLNN